VVRKLHDGATDGRVTGWSMRRGGGKLILWHGRSDQHVSPQATLSYYEAMRQVMGGRVVDSFTRLSLFPAMAHCGGGLGPNTFGGAPRRGWFRTST
jgi:feruloyl esterase